MQNLKGPKLGSLEMRVLAWTQLKKKTVIRSADLQQPLGLSPKQLREVLSRLKRTGIILRLTGGVYLVPDKIPPGGQWGPDRLWVLDQFMKIYDANYQIAGLEAFNRYGVSNQVPNVLTVYNNRISGRRTIGGTQYELIKVRKQRLGGTIPMRLREGGEVPFPSLARTLMDAVYDWSRFNLLSESLKRIVREAKKDRKFVSELFEIAIRYGNVGTLRRIGYVLETRAEITKRCLHQWQNALSGSRSLISLNPALPRKGMSSPKWGIIEND